MTADRRPETAECRKCVDFPSILSRFGKFPLPPLWGYFGKYLITKEIEIIEKTVKLARFLLRIWTQES